MCIQSWSCRDFGLMKTARPAMSHVRLSIFSPGSMGASSFVDEFQGDIIAYAAGVVKLGRGAIFEPEGERYLNVDEVFVHADHRGRGVGMQLMQALLEKAEAGGVVRSMVGSNNVDWLSTFQFYERHGYRMLSIQMYK